MGVEPYIQDTASLGGVPESRRSLDVLFKPRTVAVIGATEARGSVGRAILRNLVDNPFGGTVFPVNPKRPSVLGIKSYHSITAVPELVELAVIVTPATTVPSVIGECVAAGVKAAVVISAGFKECGVQGVELERQILEQARRGNMRIIGPNCLGIMSPVSGLNATFATTIARPGSVGFISQSGALCTAILDWSLQENVGFSAFVSIGSMLDVGWGDLIDYLGDDPHTRSIVIYMESIGNASAFLSAAREVALTKPIIVIKAGRTNAAAKAAASHTGSLVGSDEVLDAAFRRCGVLRVDRIADLFYMAEVLGKQPRPSGPRLTIVTNAGGPGVLATDALIANQGELAEISPDTLGALNQILPPHWSHSNPIDVLGDAGPDRYAKALEIAAKDPASDGLLVVLTPQGMTTSTEIARRLAQCERPKDKPILASWMGGDEVAEGVDILNRANIPTFPYPDTAAQAFEYMWRYSYNLHSLYETPRWAAEATVGGRERATGIIESVRQSGRTILTEPESKEFLNSYGIPIVRTLMARNESDAVQYANELGYPVVLKLLSETITHKTEAGGVRLNLPDEAGVRAAYRQIEKSATERVGASAFQGVTVQPMITSEGYELIIGSSVDPQFGPVLMFGAGGQFVEVFRDRALGLPPLNTTLARRMMERTRIFQALQGVRGRKPVDLAELERLLVRFSRLVVEQPWIKEIDINPLLSSSEQLIALDARIVLHDADTPEERLPKPVIRPYPAQYVGSWTLKTGGLVTIRPIQPEDEPLIVEFHKTLSAESVYHRYFAMMNLSARIDHQRLTRMCFIDYNRAMALVAEHDNPTTGAREIIGVGRLTKLLRNNEAEFAVLISDHYQYQGLGTELLRRLLSIGRDEELSRIVGDILPENAAMQDVCRRLGFQLRLSAEEEVVKAEIVL